MSEATMSREDEIKARLEKATKGPWYWNVNPKHKQIELRNGGNIVMDFIRWGMGGAMPRFNIRGLMRKASELTSNWPGRDHHASWAQQLSNPDAVFIAHAREDVPWLLAEVARLRAETPKQYTPISDVTEGFWVAELVDTGGREPVYVWSNGTITVCGFGVHLPFEKAKNFLPLSTKGLEPTP